MTQICRIKADAEKHRQEVLTTTNTIESAIQTNNVIFGEKWEATHDRIDRRSEDIRLLKNRLVDLEALSGLQQNALQSCQNTIAGLEETVLKLAASVTILEKSVCRCRDCLLSPGPHYASGEEEEMVEETEEEEEEKEEEEEEGLEYVTDTPLGGSYTTLPSTGGRPSPLGAPSTGGKGSITQWVHVEYMEGSETICPTFTQWVRGGYFSKVPTKVPTG